jgi:hypothetical protein
MQMLGAMGGLLLVVIVVVAFIANGGGDEAGANASPVVRESGATGVAVALYALGMLALMLGGLIFAFVDTSIHQILATLIGLMGAIFFAAGAVVTELQRIKKQLQADAMRLATHNPQP